MAFQMLEILQYRIAIASDHMKGNRHL